MPMRVGEQGILSEAVAQVTCPQDLVPFVKGAPLAVLVRSCLERLLDEAALKELFDDTAEENYERELTLAFLVETMLEVACGTQPSPNKAYLNRTDARASIGAFYGKLRRLEPAISAAVVEHFAHLAQGLITTLGAPHPEPIDGYRARVVDGTVLGGRTDHRIKPLRNKKAAGLTGMALAVYAPAQRLIRQVVLEEDAYTQERSLLDRLTISPAELWIADSHFCIRRFLFKLHRAHAAFVIRWHGSACPYEELESVEAAQTTPWGAKEHQVSIKDEAGQWLTVRRIVLPLTKPTRNGDTELVLMTNLPDSVNADRIGELYRDRWQIEVSFQRLTELLHSELPGLDYPRAALFAFGMAVTAANALAVVLQALEVRHGPEAVEELSYYSLVLEISQVWKGMALVVPSDRWEFVRNCSLEAFANWVGDVAQAVPMNQFRRSRRGPKKPPPDKQSGKQHKHLSNKRLLDQAKM